MENIWKQHKKKIIGSLIFLLLVAAIYVYYRIKKMAKHKGITQSTIDFLKEEEGVRTVVYKDIAGKDTVGVGHLVLPADGLKFGDVISEEKVDSFLKADVKTAADCVIAKVTRTLNQSQFNALVSLVYNIGCGAFTSSTVRKYLNDSKISDKNIKSAWHSWKNAGGKYSDALFNRRVRETDLFFS